MHVTDDGRQTTIVYNGKFAVLIDGQTGVSYTLYNYSVRPSWPNLDVFFPRIDKKVYDQIHEGMSLDSVRDLLGQETRVTTVTYRDGTSHLRHWRKRPTEAIIHFRDGTVRFKQWSGP